MSANDRIAPPLQTLAGYVHPAILSGIDCLAVGGYRVSSTLALQILRIRQRPTQPCVLDIDYEAEGEGIYEIYPAATIFSTDTTDGVDGTWYMLTALSSDPQHSGNIITVQGKVQGRFVVNMCNHVTDFLTQPRTAFRLTFILSDLLPDPTIDGRPSL